MTQIFYDKQEFTLPSTFFSACDMLSVCLGTLKKQRVGWAGNSLGWRVALTHPQKCGSVHLVVELKSSIYLCDFGMTNDSLNFWGLSGVQVTKHCKVRFQVFLKAALREVVPKATGASRSRLAQAHSPAIGGKQTSMVLHAAGKMERTVLLRLAAEPADLKWFIFYTKSGQPEAVGGEHMAPAQIPCGGSPSSYLSIVGKVRSSELPRHVPPARLAALTELQGRAVEWLRLLSVPSAALRVWDI